MWRLCRSLVAHEGHSAMLRLAQVGVIALAAVASVNADQRKIDCAEAYLTFMHELMLKEMPTERRVALHRWALRAYNACDTGDLQDPKGLFERLRREKAGLPAGSGRRLRGPIARAAGFSV
jgi:hypothetical protein